MYEPRVKQIVHVRVLFVESFSEMFGHKCTLLWYFEDLQLMRVNVFFVINILFARHSS